MALFIAAVEKIGRTVVRQLEEMGRVFLLFLSVLSWMLRPPLRIKTIFRQMEFVGVKSAFVVVLTGTFTGMVMVLQTYHGFKIFNAEAMVGGTVALAMTRELGPVLTALMVTARAGSAMAAELGSMRVTEQIDALSVMAANPVKYLIVPRVVAAVLMLPLLTVISDFMGIAGGYFVGIHILHISEGVFVNNMIRMMTLPDIYHGLTKAMFFAVLLSMIGCYKGFNTKGGAEGVGQATTEAVVLASISILVSDYFLTAIMW